MKKMAIALFLGAQFITHQASAVITISGTTSWTIASSINDDVVIEPTGMLLIYADVEMAAGKSILVKDGGRLYAIDARFHGAHNNQWQGIKLAPTTSNPQNLLALKLIDCTIEDAVSAIYFQPGIQRNYHIRASTFTDNKYHLQMFGNTKMPFQTSEIISTQFLTATGGWPIFMDRPYRLSITNCRFDYNINVTANAQRGIHMDHPEEIVIKSSTFNRVGTHSISLHFDFKNVEISENTFTALPPFMASTQGLTHAAIELGAEMPTTGDNILISKNKFVNGDLSNNLGIVGVWADDIHLSNLVISENLFKDFDRGIDFQHVNSGANSINNNDFYNYDTAIKFRDNNDGLNILDIHCNRFMVGNLGSVAIDGSQGTLNSVCVLIDPANQFVNTDFDIIYNIQNGYLEYAKHPSNPNPPTLFTGVNMSIATTITDCKLPGDGTGDDPNQDTKSRPTESISANVFPNPANELVTIQFEGKFDFVMLDAKGAVVFQGNSEGSETISVVDLQPGIYFVQINNGVDQTTQKLIIQ